MKGTFVSDYRSVVMVFFEIFTMQQSLIVSSFSQHKTNNILYDYLGVSVLRAS